MTYSQFDTPPKELVSDSLQDAFEIKKNTNDHFMMASLVVNKDYFFSGVLLGIDVTNDPRLDIKTTTNKGFNFIKNISLTKNPIHSLVITLGDELAVFPGPFVANTVKILETDYENRTCVLAIDLFKIQP